VKALSQKEKSPCNFSQGLFIILAPRPGLEPGTYGLTVQVTPDLMLRKSKIYNGFLRLILACFSMPNRKLNLVCRWWVRWLKKLI
jgi:hypothetical protein